MGSHTELPPRHLRPETGQYECEIIMESSPKLTPASPAAAVAPYLGGKRRLARRIVERIAMVPHRTYAEVMVGMGGVFFRRPFRAEAEVINDINLDVATLFRVLQNHYQALMDQLRWQLTSRDDFERLLALPPDRLTDLQRAARFLYLQRTAFGGKIEGRTFGVSPATAARFDVTRLAAVLDAARDRLACVTIERLPWRDFIERYDRPGTLFYLDPPYWGSETDYGAGVWSRSAFAELAGVLKAIQGGYILSINDVPAIRELFVDADLEPVQTTYTIGEGDVVVAAELLISNSAAAQTGDLFS